MRCRRRCSDGGRRHKPCIFLPFNGGLKGSFQRFNLPCVGGQNGGDFQNCPHRTIKSDLHRTARVQSSWKGFLWHHSATRILFARGVGMNPHNGRQSVDVCLKQGDKVMVLIQGSCQQDTCLARFGKEGAGQFEVIPSGGKV